MNMATEMISDSFIQYIQFFKNVFISASVSLLIVKCTTLSSVWRITTLSIMCLVLNPLKEWKCMEILVANCYRDIQQYVNHLDFPFRIFTIYLC